MLGAGLLVGLGAALVGLALSYWPPAENLERNGLDLLFLIRGPRPVPPSVCVVALDEDSLALLAPGAPRWPRHLHAQLVRTLRAAGARAVAFDVVFDLPGDPAEDAAFEAAMRETGRVVLGATIEQVRDPRFQQVTVIGPHERFAAAAAAVGEVNLPQDRDGVIRSTWPAHDDRESLALAAVRVAGSPVPKDVHAGRFIDYYGPTRTIPTASMYQALDPEGTLPPGFFRDRIVFVGLSQGTAAGAQAKDAFLTPYRRAGEATYGVEIHATIAANLVEGRRIHLLGRAGEAAVLLLVPIAAGLLFVRVRPLAGAVVFVSLEGVAWIGGALAFALAELWLPLVILSAIELPVVYGGCLLWTSLTTLRDRERIRRAFSFYLSPDMIRKVTAEGADLLRPGGEEVVATALMTDVAGFTTIAEGLTPPETAAMLNAYFSRVTRHVFDTGGTLIKYIGDAVFAIWGAPVSMEDHATRACTTALTLARSQDQRQREQTLDGRLVTRIGVHTGPMLVGNLGSAQRFDYTAIGDAVNLAARLEGLNKVFGTRAVASAAALEATDGRFLVRPLGRVRVVGRAEPVAVFELLALREEAEPRQVDLARDFTAALDLWGAGRLDDAEHAFRRVLADWRDDDGPTEFYLRDLERRRAEAAPAEPWDAVVTVESK